MSQTGWVAVLIMVNRSTCTSGWPGAPVWEKWSRILNPFRSYTIRGGRLPGREGPNQEDQCYYKLPWRAATLETDAHLSPSPLLHSAQLLGSTLCTTITQVLISSRGLLWHSKLISPHHPTIHYQLKKIIIKNSENNFFWARNDWMIKIAYGDFPGGPQAKSPCSQCRRRAFGP